MTPAIDRDLTVSNLHLRVASVQQPGSEDDEKSDYRIKRLLGKGGMGNVYIALQGSLDRQLALKIIRPLDDDKKRTLQLRGNLEQVEQERRQQFISEAVVTGDLDHPNIVPIHEIALTNDGTLFYSMKRVSGSPWSKVIAEKKFDENIEILLKVCDAIAFAHTRHVVHRDIKPENIMLGEFGVVMVMDWGLALPKQDFEKLASVYRSSGLGGSPAYMAPEMATGPVERIGPASDIYLLGATLFQIITSWAPHHASNVSECLRVVANNVIREVPEKFKGELLTIALKAMATRDVDRYPDVISFQNAIRDFQSHRKSIELATQAQRDLKLASTTRVHNDFARAMFGFEEASKSWSGNESASEGLKEAKLRSAEAAYEKGDLDLGLSLLNENDESHQPLISRIATDKKERLSRVARLKLLRNLAAAMLAFILIGGGVAIFLIQQQTNKAVAEKEIAERAKVIALEKTKEATLARDKADAERKRAVVAENVALQERDNAKKSEMEEATAKVAALASEQNAIRSANDAIDAKKVAESERKVAENERKRADVARADAVYENYLSDISLAKARIDQNEFDEARRILTELKDKAGELGVAWEWRWLWRQTDQAAFTLALKSPARSLDLITGSPTVALTLDNGSVQWATLRDGALEPNRPARVSENGPITAMAMLPGADTIVVGTQHGDIEVWNSKMTKRIASWTAHATTVTRLLLVDDSILLSASDDRSIRLWELRQSRELASCWNLGPVKDIAFARSASGDSLTLVSAIAESNSGRATLWNLRRDGDRWAAKQTGEFLEHDRPVTCVAITNNGSVIASGDVDGRVLLWNAADASTVDYAAELQAAIKAISRKQIKPLDKPSLKVKAQALVNADLSRNSDSPPRAHADQLRVVNFSNDGRSLLTGGDDYLIRVWDTATAKPQSILRGHGGPVWDARFLDDLGERVISCSADSTVRTWRTQTTLADAISTAETLSQREPLHREAILSARLNHAGDAVVTGSRDRTALVSKIDPETMTLNRIVELRDDDDAFALREGTQFLAQSFVVDSSHGFLYVASADGIVRVWDLDRGTERFQIQQTGLNTSLTLSRDGRYLLTRSGLDEAKTLLWRIDKTGNNAPSLAHRFRGHATQTAVTALAISDDGSTLFTADNVGVGFLWDAKSGKSIGEKIEMFRGYRINAACFVRGGRELLIAADDMQVSRLDLATRSVISRLAHPGLVTSLCVTDDDSFAITICEETTNAEARSIATLWNLRTGVRQTLDRGVTSLKKEIGVNGKYERVRSAQISPDGRWITIAKQTERGGVGRIVLWKTSRDDKATLANAFKLPASLGTPQACIPISAERMLTLNGDAAFQWGIDARDGGAANHLISYRANASVHHANFSFDDRFVITGSHSVKVWDLQEKRSVAKIETPHDGPLTCVEFTPETNSYHFVTSGSEGKVKLFDFDPDTSEVKFLKEWFTGESLPAIRKVCYSRDGKMILAVGDRGTVRLIDLEKESVTSYDAPEAGSLLAAAISADGNWIAVAGEDRQARLWPINVQPVFETVPIVLRGHAEAIEDIAFLVGHGPLRVLTASRDKSARVWDPQVSESSKDGREVLVLRKHAQGLTAIDLVPSGDLVITAGRDAEVILWPAGDLDLR